MSSDPSEAARVLGDRIRDERRRFAISQMDLAELAGLHFTNLGRIERGQANPSLSTILRIASALNLNPAFLVDGLTADMLPDRPHTVTVADLIRARTADEEKADEKKVDAGKADAQK
ncbi:helix-turn-helix domain-containing protein [Herbiconiux sp. CPCC 205763]|uniref:Helix-turn-helix domain-containing protein n=1 Tax=Herbiconiux aconitum TaxID=2970913 RepID=A0ABT2GSG2_9MICO|nr:helix-turn-helix transcriptional regulator [Herbiconiux aconitum]MCS5719103.1 helix-turn-helix domain-containing protein [Herbiconiux aconitum]